MRSYVSSSTISLHRGLLSLAPIRGVSVPGRQGDNAVILVAQARLTEPEGRTKSFVLKATWSVRIGPYKRTVLREGRAI